VCLPCWPSQAIVILYYYPQVPQGLAPIACNGPALAARGNLIDRLTQGHVTDFISVGSFPVLNGRSASP
jgi:signal peptidase II